MKKILLAMAFLLLPALTGSNKLAIDLIPTSYAAEKFSNETITVKGVTYTGTDYVSSYKYPKKSYDGSTKVKMGKNTYTMNYRQGLEPGTIDVEMDLGTKVFVANDYPMDKVPAQVYNGIYKVEKINDNNGKVTLREDSIDESKFFPFKGWAFENQLPAYQKGSVKVGDKLRLWVYPPTSAGKTLYFNKIYKWENTSRQTSTQPAGIEQKQPASKKDLANTVFITLVKTEAAKSLMEINPKATKPFQGNLIATIDGSKVLIDEAYKVFLGRPAVTAADQDYAVIELMRLYYDKKIETDQQKRLALNLYTNMVTKEASKTLLEKAPNAARKVENELRNEINRSNMLMEEAIKVLQ